MSHLSDRRLAFDQVAEVYDRARPGYPSALFDDLLAFLGQREEGPAARVVEVGPGTGQATQSLLARGCHVTGVELGTRLAGVLRQKFPQPELEVIQGAFEDAVLPPGCWDVVFVATAFHWLDPAVRLKKPAALLRGGGVVGIVGTNQISSEVDRGFFGRAFPIYRKYRPDEEPRKMPGEDVVPAEYLEVSESGLFEPVALHRCRWDQRYGTAAYLDLLRSHSDTQSMEHDAREGLLAGLGDLIEREFEGVVVRPLLVTLTVGRSARLA